MSDPQNQGGGAAPNQPPTYTSQFDNETRGNADLMKGLPPTVTELAKRDWTNQQLLRRAVIIPSAEKPDPAEKKALFEKMGIPEKAEDYQFNTAAIKDLPGVDELVAEVRTHAAEMSLNKTQAQKYLEKVAGIAKKGLEQQQKASKELEDTFEARLMDAVGKDETKKTAAINLSKAALVRFFGDQEVLGQLKNAGILYNPRFILGMAAAQEATGEAPMVRGSGPGAQKAPVKGTQGQYSPEWEAAYGKNRKES